MKEIIVGGRKIRVTGFVWDDARILARAGCPAILLPTLVSTDGGRKILNNIILRRSSPVPAEKMDVADIFLICKGIIEVAVEDAEAAYADVLSAVGEVEDIRGFTLEDFEMFEMVGLNACTLNLLFLANSTQMTCFEKAVVEHSVLKREELGDMKIAYLSGVFLRIMLATFGTDKAAMQSAARRADPKLWVINGGKKVIK
ncbi:MAG: hypothetical protein ABSG75_12570 [Syntrophales bacterium]|jgi:hypothetical protein